MNRRRMMAALVQTGQRLPSEYQEVEWISPTGVNRIDLSRIAFNGNAIIRCRYWMENQASSEQALIMASSYRSTCFEIGFSSIANRLFAFSAGGTSAVITDSMIYRNWVDLEAVYSTSTPTKALSVTANGTTKTATGAGANNTDSNAKIALFNSPNSFSLLCYAKLAYVQIILDGVETLYLVPCYRKSDNLIGVYDLISKSFYGSYDSTMMSKGADV